jgi:hypothetical protein
MQQENEESEELHTEFRGALLSEVDKVSAWPDAPSSHSGSLSLRPPTKGVEWEVEQLNVVVGAVGGGILQLADRGAQLAPRHARGAAQGRAKAPGGRGQHDE